MRRLHPEPAEIDDVAAFVAAEPRPTPEGRPWVLVNMVAALDGAVTVEGRSGGLARPADKTMFHALRAVADVVLVGAGTVRAERYGPAAPSEAVRAQRVARGQSPAPRVAVVTRSLDLDLDQPLFADAQVPPILLVCDATPEARRAAAAEVAEVIVAGGERVDVAVALRALHERGVGTVTCEGGPELNGELLAADLIDEWALTISPALVGPHARRAVEGSAPDEPRPMDLARVLEGDGLLLTRWVRAR